jgi:hypothetical protein
MYDFYYLFSLWTSGTRVHIDPTLVCALLFVKYLANVCTDAFVKIQAW